MVPKLIWHVTELIALALFVASAGYLLPRMVGWLLAKHKQ
jgi:hypothetical protein